MAPTPGFNTEIPSQLMTPASVQTRLGEFNFFDGIPDVASTERAFDCLDLLRGIDCFLDLVPMASLEALREGHAQQGVKSCSDMLITDELMDSTPLFLTGNTDTVYASGFLDLQRDGPTVIEIPPGSGPGTVDDAYFRFVIDTGSVGADRGQGGKYLILPPGPCDLDLHPPEGGAEYEVGGTKYFTAKSTTYTNWLILRGFLVDGKPDAAAANFKTGLKVYPLAAAASPPVMNWISGSRRSMNTIHANNFVYFEEIHRVLQREPLDFLEPELRGKAAAIGLVKGKPFQPDERLRKTLEEAVAAANAMARAVAFRPRREEFFFYGKENAWQTPFVGGDYHWLRDGGNGGRDQEARLFFFYLATANTPAMMMRMDGKGSQYAIAAVDGVGNTLDGSATYSLTLPPNVPAKDFWSLVLYDTQTRSQLQTPQPFPSKNSKKDADMEYNADGSITIYFAPQAPPSKDKNWIQTVPGKAWFLILRLYGPLEAWFNKTWVPGQLHKQ